MKTLGRPWLRVEWTSWEMMIVRKWECIVVVQVGWLPNEKESKTSSRKTYCACHFYHDWMFFLLDSDICSYSSYVCMHVCMDVERPILLCTVWRRTLGGWKLQLWWWSIASNRMNHLNQSNNEWLSPFDQTDSKFLPFSTIIIDEGRELFFTIDG